MTGHELARILLSKPDLIVYYDADGMDLNVEVVEATKVFLGYYNKNGKYVTETKEGIRIS